MWLQHNLINELLLISPSTVLQNKQDISVEGEAARTSHPNQVKYSRSLPYFSPALGVLRTSSICKPVLTSLAKISCVSRLISISA